MREGSSERASERGLRWPVLCLLLASCSDQYGGLTANLVFGERPGFKRQSLRAEAVPMVIDRLQIMALADGSTLTDPVGNPIETNLVALPVDGEEQLLYEGGEWELSRVPAGENRSILARAYLGPTVDARVVGRIGFEGRLDGISVRAGETRNAGTVELVPQDVPIPEVDQRPPLTPSPVSALAAPAGEVLNVQFTQPEDGAGYVLAVTSSAGADPPGLPQASTYMPGQELAPGIVVHTVWAQSGPELIAIRDLTNGIPYTVFVYAYDADLDGRPLNYSPPAIAVGIPRDTLEPDAVTNLAVGPTGSGATIAFNEPGEDRETPGAGKVTAYEVRASLDEALLENPETFKNLPIVAPPQPIDPGALISFERSFAALGVAADQPFFVGIRAIDAATNAGVITTAQFTITATQPPAIDAIDPQIAIAGRELTLRGQNFGVVPVAVRLTTTGTSVEVFTLPITRWDNTRVVVTIPRTARTGTVELVRGDSLSATAFLPVVLRIEGVIDDYQPPFEAIGATAPNGSTVISALYREAGEYTDFDAAVERIVGLAPEAMPFAPAVIDPHSTAVAGTYSAAYDRFMFVASTNMLTMSTMFVTSSTVAPDPLRIGNGVSAGNADRVSVVFLDGGTNGRYPALLAFTFGGAIRTATVTDVLLQPFNLFYALTSTVETFDRVALQRNSDGDVLMAHRAISTTPPRSNLVLRLNTENGSPDDFVLLPAATFPQSGQNFEIISVPTGPGCAGPEAFVVAYEAIGPGGLTEVRLLPQSNYGVWSGYSPLPSNGRAHLLEDVGLICREGTAWLALLTTSPTGLAASELTYTEVPFDAINEISAGGGHPGVVLDIASDGTRGRVACKPHVQDTCPIIWSGDDEVRVLFVRR